MYCWVDSLVTQKKPAPHVTPPSRCAVGPGLEVAEGVAVSAFAFAGSSSFSFLPVHSADGAISLCLALPPGAGAAHPPSTLHGNSHGSIVGWEMAEAWLAAGHLAGPAPPPPPGGMPPALRSKR